MSIIPQRYNEIPSYVFEGVESILELGAGSGDSQLFSKYREDFLRCAGAWTWVGPEDDFFSRFWGVHDLVLAVHVMEHIPREEWDKYLVWLESHAKRWLVVCVPYRQKRDLYDSYFASRKKDLEHHVVFDIDEKTFYPYLGHELVSYVRRPYHIVRELKMRLSGHPLAKARRLVVVKGYE